MKNELKIDQLFLFLVLALAGYFVYIIFEPYLSIILLAGVFSILLTPVFNWIIENTKDLNNPFKVLSNRSLASFITVMLFILVIIVPISNFIVLLARESAQSYSLFEQKFLNGNLDTTITELKALVAPYLPMIEELDINVRDTIVSVGSRLNSYIFSATAALLKGTTSFITNLFILLLTMYYLLKDGGTLRKRIVHLTPLPEKYDDLVFDKFKEISRSTILSTLFTAFVQGAIASVSFAIVGLPIFILGVFTAIASVIPIVGTGLVFVPLLIYLLISGDLFGFVVVLIFAIIVGISDNFIRVWFLKGGADIHPMLLFFAIFGGVVAFGALGVIFGPLALAILLTLLHIYELEYKTLLNR